MTTNFRQVSILILSSIFLLVNIVFAQQEKFDSLKKMLPNAKQTEKKINLYLEIALSIYNSIPDSSIIYYEKARELSQTNNLKILYAQSLHGECRYILLKGDVKKTIEKLNEAIAIFEERKELKLLAKSYSLKAVALGVLNKNEDRLAYLTKAKEIYLNLNDNDGLSSIYSNLAHAYGETGQFQKGLNVLKLEEELKLPKSSRTFYTEINYGVIYYNLKQYIQAIIHFRNSVEIAKKYKMLDSEITGLTHVAECYQKLNKTEESKVYYNKALEIASKNNLLVEEADALKGYTILLEDGQDFKNAFYSLKRLKLIQDSLYAIEKIKSINEIENKLKLSEKEKIIAEQNLSLEKEKVAHESSKTNSLLLFGGLVVLGIAVFFLIFHNHKTKKLVALIQTQKKEVELQKEIIEVKNKEVTDSIVYARYIQGSMLPSDKAMRDLAKDSFVFYKPKDIVAGDFYWTETVNGNKYLAVCDCTGHGVPGAMVSIVACNALNRAVKEFNIISPEKIFDKVNVLMQETFSKSDYSIRDGMDGVLCYIDEKTKKMHIAAANNPVWIIRNQLKDSRFEIEQLPTHFSNFNNKTLIEIKPDKIPIGKFNEQTSSFNLKSFDLQTSDMIYFFTDGYADQFGGEKGKKFKYKKLQELLIGISDKDLSEQKNILDKTIANWQGKLDQIDDILIVGVRV